jgi:AcrR family transcriptional regulator
LLPGAPEKRAAGERHRFIGAIPFTIFCVPFCTIRLLPGNGFLVYSRCHDAKLTTIVTHLLQRNSDMTLVSTPRNRVSKNAESGAAQPRQRDAEVTKARILEAAKKEFAKLGLAGARVEAITTRAKVNKRMLYHYFGSKEDLFQAVVEDAYADIRFAEQKLHLEHLSPQDAVVALVTHTWNYYLKNPEFMTLVNSENLHKARHVKNSERFKELHHGFISMLQGILDRGVKAGVFRAGVDARQLHITIAAIGYYYLTNRFTSGVIFDIDFMSKDALKNRLDFNIDTILRTLRP